MASMLPSSRPPLGRPRSRRALTPLLLLVGCVVATAAALRPARAAAAVAAADGAASDAADGTPASAADGAAAFPPPTFFAPASNLQARQNYTTLSKRTAINSTHLIPFNLTNHVFVDRAVRVTNSSKVALTPPPRVVVAFESSGNVQFRLNDTDALDVGDDEALDVMNNGMGKALAGELDGLTTIFPGSSINTNGGGAGGQASPVPPPPNRPSGLSAALLVHAGFNVSATMGTDVHVMGEPTVEGSSDVTLAGLQLDVSAKTLNNTQFVSQDSDFADTADNGGTTVLQTGPGLALAGEVEELPEGPAVGRLGRRATGSRNSRWRRSFRGGSVVPVSGGGDAGAAAAAEEEEGAAAAPLEEEEEEVEAVEPEMGRARAAPSSPEALHLSWRTWRPRLAGGK